LGDNILKVNNQVMEVQKGLECAKRVESTLKETIGKKLSKPTEGYKYPVTAKSKVSSQI
jgi:hypothetical protein